MCVCVYVCVYVCVCVCVLVDGEKCMVVTCTKSWFDNEECDLKMVEYTRCMTVFKISLKELKTVEGVSGSREDL